MGQYLTPDDSGGTIVCRRLRFRAELAGFITEALERLTHAGWWEQFGTMTPQECADAALGCLNFYLDSGDRCMTGELWIGITDYPDGVLPFDGVQRLREDYPALYAVLDDAFKDDADHFTLHEAYGRALVVSGAGTGLTERQIGDSWGDESHYITANEAPEHFHNYRRPITELSAVLGEITGIGFAYEEGAETETAFGGDTPLQLSQPSFAVRVGVWAR